MLVTKRFESSSDQEFGLSTKMKTFILFSVIAMAAIVSAVPSVISSGG